MNSSGLAILASVLLVFLGAGAARADSIDISGAEAIVSLSVEISASTIVTTEVWSGTGPGVLLLTLDEDATGTPFEIVRNISFDDGLFWTDVEIEILDPFGQANDALDLDPLLQPGDVPVGFTTSNDADGLFFDVSAGDPSSDAFTSFTITTGDRDLLTFDGAAPGGVGGSVQLIYTFRDQRGPFSPGDAFGTGNNSFLMFARPSIVLPEPGQVLWLAFALIGAAFVRRG